MLIRAWGLITDDKPVAGDESRWLVWYVCNRHWPADRVRGRRLYGT